MAFQIGERVINLEETVIRKLKTVQHVLCTVESCTGGLISNFLTNVSGASEVYWGSIVPYDNSAKEELGVSRQLLMDYGAVSAEVARALADQGLERMQATLSRIGSSSLIKPRGFICIATTGIAGPTGGTREKPVGLCFIGLAMTGKKTLTEEFHVASTLDRIQIKTQFAQQALEMIRGQI